jgi:hypothetical protein
MATAIRAMQQSLRLYGMSIDKMLLRKMHYRERVTAPKRCIIIGGSESLNSKYEVSANLATMVKLETLGTPIDKTLFGEMPYREKFVAPEKCIIYESSGN